MFPRCCQKLLRIPLILLAFAFFASGQQPIGRETGMSRHIQDDEEFRMTLSELLDWGKKAFCASWTDQDGAGRPLTKGNGKELSDPSSPLVGKRAFNRISGPDANSCMGCHNMPYGIPGGSGDLATSVFVLGQRFDFVTFDPGDKVPTRGAVDERSRPVSLDDVADLRATTDMFGSGYLEMLAREMTADLQRIRDSIAHGQTRALVTKGVSFGALTRRPDGTWDVSKVTGLSRLSVLTRTPLDPPTLVIRPWSQAASFVSLREFTENALNQHHGMQATERFGRNTDPDGDGVVNEMTRADVTALTLYQASLQVPGRVIPNNPEVEKAVLHGEREFAAFGCAKCHLPELPLTKDGSVFVEPGPYNPPTNLRAGETKAVLMDLSDAGLPQPRLPRSSDVIMVPAYTDMKLHDITSPDDEVAAEPLDMNQPSWSPKFFEGNRRFLTKRLWGCANQPPYYHNGFFTTMRSAVLAHSGEALESRKAFQTSADYDQDSLIEFLKTLQILPPGTKDLIVDENFKRKSWPPKSHEAAASEKTHSLSPNVPLR
jgi:hypothetical protein